LKLCCDWRHHKEPDVLVQIANKMKFKKILTFLGYKKHQVIHFIIETIWLQVGLKKKKKIKHTQAYCPICLNLRRHKGLRGITRGAPNRTTVGGWMWIGDYLQLWRHAWQWRHILRLHAPAALRIDVRHTREWRKSLMFPGYFVCYFLSLARTHVFSRTRHRMKQKNHFWCHSSVVLPRHRVQLKRRAQSPEPRLCVRQHALATTILFLLLSSASIVTWLNDYRRVWIGNRVYWTIESDYK
jgi:hypothetical protein